MLSLALSFVGGSVGGSVVATHPYYELWVNSGNIGYMTNMLGDGL